MTQNICFPRELQGLCGDAGLSKSGKTTELAKRLADHEEDEGEEHYCSKGGVLVWAGPWFGTVVIADSSADAITVACAG